MSKHAQLIKDLWDLVDGLNAESVQVTPSVIAYVIEQLLEKAGEQRNAKTA